MLGRRNPPRAASADVANRRLAALEASFPARARPHPRPDDRETPDVDEVDADNLDGDDAWRPSIEPQPRARGRHAATSLAPVRSLALTAQQVTLVALVVAAVVAVAAWWVIRAAPRSEPVQLAQERVFPPLAESTAGATPAPTGAPIAQTGTVPTAAESLVVVDVAGKVRHPGIVELPAGSRVVDALRAAGGARRAVDTSALNLARLLVDGEQIVVGVDVPAVPPASTETGSATEAITPVDLNTATLEQLDTLPGVGPVTAQAILDWRTENGSFTSVDELLEVSGIGDATLADIEAYVYV
jgi:competence protein ComEA